jgi:hypothetical protein
MYHMFVSIYCLAWPKGVKFKSISDAQVVSIKNLVPSCERARAQLNYKNVHWVIF